MKKFAALILALILLAGGLLAVSKRRTAREHK